MLRKCPYQAKVMKKLEPVRRIAALSAGCCSMKVGMAEKVRWGGAIIADCAACRRRRDMCAFCPDAVIEFALFRGRKGLEQTP
jgi:hypothetical protein